MHLTEPLWCLAAIVTAILLARTIAAFAAPTIPLPKSPAAAPRLDKWIVIGPGGGGGQFFPAVSPHDPNIVVLRCDMTGAFISKDGGNSWRMFNLRAPASLFVFDPVDPKTLYAYVGGLWRSTDIGDTWSLVYPNPKDVKGIIVNDDHAGWTWDSNRPVGVMRSFRVDPADSRILYAIIEMDRIPRIYRSTDWGETWGDYMDRYPIDEIAQPVDPKTGAPVRSVLRLYVDPKSPKDDRTIYFIENDRVAVREGGKWKRFAPSKEAGRFYDLSIGWPKDGGRPVMYAVAPTEWKGDEIVGGILVSADGGETWTSHNRDFAKEMMKGAPAPLFQTIATCQTDPSVAYVSYRFLRFGTERWDFYFGVAKTEDGGRNWDLAIKDTYYKASPAEKDAWLNELYHPEWGDAPFCLYVAPTDPNICYGTDFGRTMRTTDGLKTWVGVYSRKIGDGWATTGLDVTTCYGAHRDPHDPKRILISYTDMGLFRSEDGGSTWVHAINGIPKEWANTTYWIAFDPEVKGRVWAGSGANHDLPRPKMWRGKPDVSHYRGGVVTSADGGKMWTKSNSGMTETDVTHIVIDPKSPRDARVLYATGFGTGVWKSVDGGKSWKLKRKGLKGKEPFAWRLAMDGDGVLYLVVARRSEDGSYGNDLDGALYCSADGAENWTQVRLPEGVNGPNGLFIDPRDVRRMCLAAWGRIHKGGAVDGGVFLTTDGAATWQNVLSANQYVYDVTADPANPDILYACGFESSAWRSINRGETWTRIKGYTFKWGHRVMPDPVNPGMVFVSTFGGSVWYGPAEGDPDAAEDIVTPNVAYDTLKR